MGFRQLRISDLSGEVIEDADVVTVILKGHPASEDNRIFDTTKEEIKALKSVRGLVELEIKDADGVPVTMYVDHADLAKVVPDEKVTTFDLARGRRSGYRPGV